MATYIHSKMAANANKGHRRWGHISGVVDKEANDKDRPRRSPRNGGKYFVRFVDGLRSRFRAYVVTIDAPGGPRQRKYTTCERLIKLNMPFGGPKGTTNNGMSIKRTNISAGDKSKIRIT